MGKVEITLKMCEQLITKDTKPSGSQASSILMCEEDGVSWLGCGTWRDLISEAFGWVTPSSSHLC